MMPEERCRAKAILEEMSIVECFDEVCGMDMNGVLDKADLIIKCCERCGIQKDNTVLIGDSNNDWAGANEAGVTLIGVIYGFGFKKHCDYEFVTANDTRALRKRIHNRVTGLLGTRYMVEEVWGEKRKIC